MLEILEKIKKMPVTEETTYILDEIERKNIDFLGQINLNFANCSYLIT